MSHLGTQAHAHTHTHTDRGPCLSVYENAQAEVIVQWTNRLGVYLLRSAKSHGLITVFHEDVFGLGCGADVTVVFLLTATGVAHCQRLVSRLPGEQATRYLPASLPAWRGVYPAVAPPASRLGPAVPPSRISSPNASPTKQPWWGLFCALAPVKGFCPLPRTQKQSEIDNW
jgi:hypothetical protein